MKDFEGKEMTKASKINMIKNIERKNKELEKEIAELRKTMELREKDWLISPKEQVKLRRNYMELCDIYTQNDFYLEMLKDEIANDNN